MAPAVPAFLDRCMEKLIDLSKRNRFLHFRAPRASSVRIVDELPPQVFRTLRAGQPMRFLPGPPPPRPAPEEPPPAGEAPVLEERHRDRNLQTELPEEALDENLLRIYQQSRSIFEEHGYNTLYLALGFLQWHESKSSPDPLRAPLFLLPVVLEHRSIEAPFVLRADDDDPVVNPALLLKLQRDFKIALPPLPEDLDTFDLAAWLDAAAAACAGDPRWKVLPDIHLAMFSFAKFAMYRDLEAGRELFTGDPRVGALAGASTWPGAAPEPPPQGPLDPRLAPESTFQVLDADSSQQETILAARGGSDLVVEGPPGTGKSQTIANLVAEFLAAGKSVLFVSEKMAALEVVYGRLKQAGLGDFCLELHSRNASKRKVAEELRRTLEAAAKPAPEDPSVLRELAETRRRLNDTVAQLHGRIDPLGESAYAAMSWLAARADLPDLGVIVPEIEALTGIRLQELVARVERFTEAIGPVRPRRDHPWRGSSLTDAPYELNARLREALPPLPAAVTSLAASAKALAERGGSPVPETDAAAGRLEELGRLLVATPKPDAALLDSADWNSFGEEATRLLQQGARFRELRERLRGSWRDDLLEASLDAAVEAYRLHGDKLFRIFNGSYRAARRLVKSLLRPGAAPDLPAIVADLDAAREAQKLRDSIAASRGAALFGSRWNGVDGDWEGLRKLGDWLVAWRRHVVEGRATAKTAEIARQGLDAAPVDDLAAKRGALAAAWERLRDPAKLDPQALWGTTLGGAPLAAIAESAASMLANLERLHEWTRYQSALAECRQAGLGELLEKALAAGVPVLRLAEAFRAQVYRCWLDAVVRKRPLLAGFDGPSHERVVEKFRELDVRQLAEARRRLVNLLLKRRPDLSWSSSGDSELGVLQHEVRKKRAHLPIRKLFARTGHCLRALKPCLLMSPLSVAQFLDPAIFSADVVVFDEASQISPEDAVGAIARGKQLVVVGDSKQLPPTSFFATEQAEEEDEAEASRSTDLESILDAVAAKGVPRRRLLWHYRSRHETLIAFSNRHFYGGELITFPSVAERRALEFRHVSGAVYERGGGANPGEAKELARALFEQLKREPDLSCGVGTFSVRQQEEVRKAIDELRRGDPSLESRFDMDEPDYCFVKNLETIQGDERDVIFISVGYGRDAAGKVSMNFGPLNHDGGDRRLNVLVTRARHRVVLFSSIKAEDIDLSRTQARGVALLKRYLEHCERGSAEAGPAAAEAPSALEEALRKALAGKGVETVARVGASSNTIDLAVRKDAEGFLLGIEADGPRYAAARTARDRDRLRRDALEARGWRFHRIWSTDWWRHPGREADRAAAAVEKARKSPPAPPKESRPLTDPGLPVPAAAPAKEGPPTGPAAQPYAVAPFTLRGSPEEFGRLRVDALAKLLVDVVRVEGPVHRMVAGRRLSLPWGITRASRKVQQAVDGALERALRSGDVRLQEDFLWPAAMKAAPVRTRIAVEEARDIDAVCLEEIEEAALLVLRKEFRLPPESLADQALRVLGFDRPGRRARDRAGKAVDLLREQGRVLAEEGWLRLPS